jgi:hypothetical protein
MLKKSQSVNERREIANIFTELVFIINTHSKDNIFKQQHVEPEPGPAHPAPKTKNN